jgi:acyl-coenzyme A thioesterase PaaI-like protein
MTNQQDQFFTATLGIPGGMGHMLCFFTQSPEQLHDPKVPVTKIHTLYSLGEKLTGISGILHGGVTMSLVDEAMSQIIELNSALGKEGPTYTNTSVTATLECKFLKGIPAEGNVLATAWLEGTERRKSFVRCEVVNEEGERLASVKSVWVSLMSNL